MSPALDWDSGNGTCELGEWLLGLIQQAAALPSPHTLPFPAELRASDGRVAEHQEPVVVSHHASKDPRFQMFQDLPEDSFEAFLSVPVVSRGTLVGVINVQHRQPHTHSRREIQLISMIGFLVGAEIEMARLEEAHLAIQRQSRQRRKTKKEIAEAIVLADDLRRGKG
ncbi:MAG: GAF domain-containing protein [Acidobacteria bacterium]|nr:GAF domain-containing protein [Acidobacteriota bacterium]